MKKTLMRLICLMMALMLTVSLFTACGSSTDDKASGETENTAGQTTSTEPEREPVEIKIWTDLQNLDPGFQAAFDAFMENNPGIKISVTHYPGDADKYPVILNTAIQANEAPDLYRTNGWNTLEARVKQEAALELDGKIDVSKFDKSFLEASMVDGKLYSTPGFRKDLLVVFYNKDLFETNNISIPKSYDEFTAACDKLLSAGITPIAYSGKETVSNIFAAYTVGPSILTPQWYEDAINGKTNFKDERFIKTLTIIKEFADKGYYGKLFKGVPFDGAKLSFQQGKAAMLFDGSWDNSGFKETEGLSYGAFFFPPLKAGDPVVGAMFNEAGFSVNSKTKHPEEALKVAQYCTTVDFYQVFCEKNSLISPIPDVKIDDLIFEDFKKADQWMLFYFPHFNKEEPSPQTKLMEGLQAVFTGNKTIDQVADDIQSIVDKDFPQFKK